MPELRAEATFRVNPGRIRQIDAARGTALEKTSNPDDGLSLREAVLRARGDQADMQRILVLNYEFPPLGGGAGNATYYLLVELAKREDVCIDLITSSMGASHSERFADNITIHYVDIGKRASVHYQSNRDLLVYAWKAYHRARKLMKDTRFDLCHAFFSIPCGYMAMRLGLPYIVSLRGSDVPFYNERFFWLDTIFFKRISRKVWRRAKMVIAVSDDLKNLALKTNPNQSISVIPNGVDTSEFFPVGGKESQSGKSILFVGRIIQRKGVNFLLEAFREIAGRHPETQLVIAGDGPLLESYRGEAVAHDIAHRVHFLGNVRHEELPAVYQAASVFVLPSLNEGCSNALLEALASGLPVISTDTGAATLIADVGIIVPKARTDLLVNALERLLSEPKEIESRGKRSRTLAETMNWRAAAGKYIACYGAYSHELA